MKNLFDRTLYPHPITPFECFGCGSDGDFCPAELLSQFIAMTGHEWRRPLVGYFLRKDFISLGLECSDVPARVELCLPCALEYMRTFNSLLHNNHSHHKAAGAEGPVRSGSDGEVRQVGPN